jgi:hypothetical protein
MRVQVGLGRAGRLHRADHLAHVRAADKHGPPPRPPRHGTRHPGCSSIRIASSTNLMATEDPDEP